MAEVVYDGVGTPVATANKVPGNPVNFNNKSPVVSLGADAALFTNSTNPTEDTLGGVGEPVADGNRSDFPVRFDNKGKEATLGAPNAIFNNSTSPTEDSFGTEGVPVGDGNRADFPVTGFDNLGKNVVVTTQAERPVGNQLYKGVQIYSPPLNFNY